MSGCCDDNATDNLNRLSHPLFAEVRVTESMNNGVPMLLEGSQFLVLIPGDDTEKSRLLKSVSRRRNALNRNVLTRDQQPDRSLAGRPCKQKRRLSMPSVQDCFGFFNPLKDAVSLERPRPPGGSSFSGSATSSSSKLQPGFDQSSGRVRPYVPSPQPKHAS